MKAQNYSDMPHGTSISDITATQAERAAKISKDTELIKQTAIEAEPEIYQYILCMATKGFSFIDLKAQGMPCEKDYFDKRRRYFYYLLAKKRGMI